MTALLPDEDIKIVSSFFKSWPMKVHWVQVPKDVRSSLARLFDKIDLKELAQELVLKFEILEGLQSEKSEMDMIIMIVAQGKEDRESSQFIHSKIYDKVVKLYGLLPNGPLADEIGIPRSSLVDIFRRAKKIKKKNTLSKRKANNVTPVKLVQAAPSKDSNDKVTLDNSKDLKELNRMLSRHSNKSQKKYSKSEKDLILKLVDHFGSKLVHEQVKVSYDTIARLLRNRERGYVVPSTKAEFMPVIDTMKKFPGMGPMQIRDYNHRHFGVSMGVNTVRKVMEDNGWFPSYSRKVVITEEPRRYEAIRRNYMWHLDFKQFYINRCKVYLLFIEDDNSRFIVGHELADAERVNVVIEALNKCITLHGKPETIMSDGGSAFYSWRGISKFTSFLEEFGIDQIVAKIPRVNGKVESINQKIEKELLLTQSFSSLNHFQSELVEWIGLYNYRRPHQGLGNLQVPADKYYPGADKWFKGGDRDNNNHMLDALSVLLKEFKKSS